MARQNLKIKELTSVALMSALMAVCSFLSFPLGAVSFTLQTLALYLALFTLGGRGGTVSVLVYLLLGSFGLPVFSGFRGGVGALFDAGGGFLFGFLLAAFVFWLSEIIFGRGALPRILTASVSLCLIYLSGSLWYAGVYLGSLSFIFEAFLVTVLPFIAFDIIKIAIAWFVSSRIVKYVK